MKESTKQKTKTFLNVASLFSLFTCTLVLYATFIYGHFFNNGTIIITTNTFNEGALETLIIPAVLIISIIPIKEYIKQVCVKIET
jgi:hypothetical protein